MLESEALQADTESHSDSGDIIGEGDDIEAINASNDGLELRSRVESGINLDGYSRLYHNVHIVHSLCDLYFMREVNVLHSSLHITVILN